MGCFSCSPWCYALYAERRSLSRYLAVAGCFALGLMAKPMLVTVPFLLLLLDYWPLDRFRPAVGENRPAESSGWFDRLPAGWRLVIEKVPLMALAAVSCGITLLTHATIHLTGPAEQLPLATRLANAPVAYVAYVGQSLYPARLALFYPHPGNRLPIGSAAAALALLMAITAVAAYCWRGRPYLLVGWLWFLGMLVPVIGLVGTFTLARADRYTYLSQIGLLIALAWGVWGVHQSQQNRQAVRWRGWMLAAVSGAAVLALAVVAWRQTSYWRDRETLWTHTLACTEQNVLARYSLGYAYAMQGKIDEAIFQLREAVAADSIDSAMIAKSHDLLGDCLATQGKTDEAFPHYEAAVRVIPAAPTVHARLAMALSSRGQLDRAIVEWREALRLAPNFSPAAHLGLANALLAKGDASGAAAQCRKVLEQKPDSVEAIVVLGAALTAEGKVEEAISQLERALELEPHNAPAHASLGLRSTIVGGRRARSLISPRQFVSGRAMSRCCGKRPGFWRRVPIPRSATEKRRWDSHGEQSSFPRRGAHAPSMHLPLLWPKPNNFPRPSTQPSKRRRLP